MCVVDVGVSTAWKMNLKELLNVEINPVCVKLEKTTESPSRLSGLLFSNTVLKWTNSRVSPPPPSPPLPPTHPPSHTKTVKLRIIPSSWLATHFLHPISILSGPPLSVPDQVWLWAPSERLKPVSSYLLLAHLKSLWCPWLWGSDIWWRSGSFSPLWGGSTASTWSPPGRHFPGGQTQREGFVCVCVERFRCEEVIKGVNFICVLALNCPEIFEH